MVEDSTPETADEEVPDADAGEGEPEGVADATTEQASDGEDPPEVIAEGEAADTEETDNEGVVADVHDGDAEAKVSAPGADVDESALGEAVAATDESSAAVANADESDGPPGEESADEESPGEVSAGDGSASGVPGPDLSEDGPDAASDGVSEDVSESASAGSEAGQAVPEDVRKYERFKKMDGAEYERVNEFLRERTYVTAREWAIARLCADFRTETGVEMTKIGQNLPRLVPFMTDTYTPQAVNQARSSFEEKVNKAGATFLYGAMSGFFTAEELDETMYEVTEIAKFLLEVEGVDLSVEAELAAEDKISEVMREVRQSSAQVRGEEVECPECGHVHDA